LAPDFRNHLWDCRHCSSFKDRYRDINPDRGLVIAGMAQLAWVGSDGIPLFVALDNVHKNKGADIKQD